MPCGLMADRHLWHPCVNDGLHHGLGWLIAVNVAQLEGNELFAVRMLIDP